MGGYRSRLEIIADMLDVVAGRARKTQIMYQANLSYGLLIKYLAQAREAYLIRFERQERCFVLTPKGKEFLQIYREYTEHNQKIEKQINEINGKKRLLEELCLGT